VRKLIILAIAAIAIAVPVAAFAGNGATTWTESWTDQSNNFGQDPCTGQLRTGIGSVAGFDRFVETPTDGFHVTTTFTATIPFYVALGPGPWDPQPGAYLGTLVIQGGSDEQDPGPAPGASSGTSQGLMTYADGTVRRQIVEFHLTFSADGFPKVFFAHFICAGG